MKKLVWTLVLPALLLAACKRQDSYNNITLDRYQLSLLSGDSQKINVQTGDPENVLWTSDNPFVATVDKGTISGIRVGTARISANNAVVSVRVNPRSNLYVEPITDFRWGVTREYVINTLGIPDRIENNTMRYDMSSAVSSFKIYMFDDNGRLIAAGITINRDKTSHLDDFLNERYFLLTDDGEINKEFINALSYTHADMSVSRNAYDNNYWIVTYRALQ